MPNNGTILPDLAESLQLMVLKYYSHPGLAPGNTLSLQQHLSVAEGCLGRSELRPTQLGQADAALAAHYANRATSSAARALSSCLAPQLHPPPPPSRHSNPWPADEPLSAEETQISAT